MTNAPSDRDVLKAIRRVLSAAAAELQLERVITDEDCAQVLRMQRADGMSNSDIIANVEHVINAETILQADENASAH